MKRSPTRMMRIGRAGASLLAVICWRAALAAGQDGTATRSVQVDTALEVWTYASKPVASNDSLLNPGNAIARLPSRQVLLDARWNLHAALEGHEAVLQPRLLAQWSGGNGSNGSNGSNQTAYASQAFVRIRPDAHWAFTGGRYRATWGPANFRSPSNPFYFDPGKNQPLRDVPGVDLVRADYALSHMTISGAWVADAGHLAGRPDIRDVRLLKLDYRWSDGSVSALASDRSGGKPFWGAFAQYSANEALMLYGELGHGQRAQHLEPPAAAHGLPVMTAPSAAETTALAGASYTLENGHIVAAEFLYDGHGYDATQAARYFSSAAYRSQSYRDPSNAALHGQDATVLGQMLNQAPALLGRRYAYLLWQSNPQDSAFYWRTALACNLQDRSTQALLYVEKNLSPRVSLFASAMVNTGRADAEFGAYLARVFSVGAKVFLF